MAYQVKQIKNLIRKGYPIELISFQLRIPIEQLIQYAYEVSNENIQVEENINYSEEARINKIKGIIIKIKENYNAQFLNTNNQSSNMEIKLSEIQIEMINESMGKITQGIEAFKTIQCGKEGLKDRIVITKMIITEVKKIMDYPLTLEQAQMIYALLNSGELRIEIGDVCSLEKYVYKIKQVIIKRIIEAVDREYNGINDIEKLRKLQKNLTPNIRQGNSIAAQTVYGKIEKKINKLNQKIAIDKIRNEIPKYIEEIVSELNNGTLNINHAQNAIDNEIRKNINKSSSSKFPITPEQERRRIITKINSVLNTKAEKYRIENPERTMLLLQQLCGETIENALRTVVRNLIETKRFNDAKVLCDKVYEANKRNPNARAIKSIMMQIKYEEVGNCILKIIKSDIIQTEEIEYISKLIQGIKQGNISLKAIPLGETFDGVNKITLEDVWPDMEKRKIQEK